MRLHFLFGDLKMFFSEKQISFIYHRLRILQILFLYTFFYQIIFPFFTYTCKLYHSE